MKKTLILILLAALLISSLCSCFDIGGVQDQGNGDASPDNSSNSTLGDYEVEIDSCRLATDYEGDAVVIVKFKFTNNGEEPASFYFSVDCNVYQDGIGLNEAYVLSESANYSADNQTKDIKKGASLYVEVAYELNDSTTDIEVEVCEYFSFSNKKIVKTFKIAE